MEETHQNSSMAVKEEIVKEVTTRDLGLNHEDNQDSTNQDSISVQSPPPPSIGLPRKTGLHLFVFNISRVFKLDEIGREIMRITVPASLALAADPLASLIDTAFIGHLGPQQQGGVGVSVAIFNQISKVCIYPLVSVTTSFVAEEDAIISSNNNNTDGRENGDIEQNGSTLTETNANGHPSSNGHKNNDIEKAVPTLNETNGNVHPTAKVDDTSRCDNACITTECENNHRIAKKRKYIPSVTSALIVGGILGILQAIFIIFTAKILLRIMGIKHGDEMFSYAFRYLTLRSLGAPAVLLSLAMQGVFRGLKDTRTPLYATLAGDLTNIVLDPLLIFVFRMGVSGAATAHVISQYLITVILLCRLVTQVDIIPPSFKSLKFKRFLGCGFMLLARVIAVTCCITLAASLASRHGPTFSAGFQVCSQLWLATSLLADGLAVAGQAVLATAFAKSDHYKIAAATARVLQLSIVLGLGLTVLLGMGMFLGAGIFAKDPQEIAIIHRAIPFVAGTQTINSLAFVFDGVNFGASDYTYSAYSMVVVAAISVPSLVFLAKHFGFLGIWTALTIYMTLRTIASFSRMGLARGPWTFLRQQQSQS